MNLIGVLLLGVGLSLDSFAVSLSLGFACERISQFQKMRFLVVIGLAHFLMILSGWFMGEQASRLIARYDHWIAFGLLLFLGLRMIREGRRSAQHPVECSQMLSFRRTFLLGIALSIDALITGFSLGLVTVDIVEGSQGLNILLTALIIGLLAYAISAVAIYFGRKIMPRTGPEAEVFGGVILVLIGIGVLLDHLS